MTNTSFRLRLHLNFVLVSSLFLCSIMVSCDDDTTRLGLGILPATDTFNIKGFDTLTIKAYTETSPAIFTGQATYSPFGYYNDPIFGSAKAEFATEFGFTGSDTIEGESLTADSAILFLEVFENGVYGDAFSNLQMEAYLINEEFPADSLHYSDYDPENFKDITSIGSNQVRFDKEEIQFYFNQQFAEMLLAPARNEDDTTYNNISAFKEKFKGLLFRTQPLDANGAIALLNLYSFTSAQQGRQIPSRIELYYHHTLDDSVVNEIITYTFERSADLHFNMYEHNYAQSDFYSNINTEVLDSVCYLQGLAGTRVRLSVPELKRWAEPGEVAVNSALLTVSLEDFDKTSDFLYPPFQLGINTIQSDGEEDFIEDLQTGSFNYFMGNLGQTSYTFNITKHVQAVIDGAENSDIFIYPLTFFDGQVSLIENYLLPERAVLTGNNNSTPIKLDILYTKL